ncbi:C40 family peptidase [Massilia sp. TN1-12]|uniref:C40 family peptidase n=1 Tax=Massilia paldalensis TaxID=3377675 RepID=UPI0038510728
MADVSDLIGTPFVYGARGPAAYDCYGLVMECARRDGVRLPDFGADTNQGVIAAMMGATLPQWREVDCRPGAVVLLRVGRHVAHVGYVVDGNRMVHTWESSGGVTTQRLDDWKQRIVGFYEYAG